VGTLDLPSHRLVEAMYTPGAAIPPHAHAAMSWALVLDGAFGSTTSIGVRRYSKNDLGLLSAGMIHANRYGTTGARCLIVEHRRSDETTKRIAGALGDAAHFPSTSLPAAIARRMYHEFATRDTAADLVIDGLLTTMTAYALRFNAGIHHSSTSDMSGAGIGRPWLNRVRDRIHADFRTKLRLGALADLAGVNAVQLSRAFSRQYGCSPMYYLRDLRVTWARQQLASSERPISEIAIEAGFSDQSHFGRHFRRLTGMTPREYRTRAGG
jgi:transcriptional regulator GlxA family with amidase domain